MYRGPMVNAVPTLHFFSPRFSTGVEFQTFHTPPLTSSRSTAAKREAEPRKENATTRKAATTRVEHREFVAESMGCLWLIVGRTRPSEHGTNRRRTCLAEGTDSLQQTGDGERGTDESPGSRVNGGLQIGLGGQIFAVSLRDLVHGAGNGIRLVASNSGLHELARNLDGVDIHVHGKTLRRFQEGRKTGDSGERGSDKSRRKAGGTAAGVTTTGMTKFQTTTAGRTIRAAPYEVAPRLEALTVSSF